MSTYSKRLAALVEDLINTYDTYLDEPEHLRTPEDLRKFLHKRGMLIEHPVTAHDLAEVRLLRNQLRAIWTADDLHTIQMPLNALLNQVSVTPQLQVNQTEPTLTFELPRGITLVQRLQFEVAVGVVGLLEQYGLERMGSCAADPCKDVFIDVSRNRSRRFCSERCANRYNIASFRDRHG